jgi:hypothetical protein
MVSTRRVMMIGLPMMLQLAIIACRIEAQVSAVDVCRLAAAAQTTNCNICGNVHASWVTGTFFDVASARGCYAACSPDTCCMSQLQCQAH